VKAFRIVVARRARDARERGVRFPAVDAGPRSRPILERMGFAYLTSTVPCTLGPPARDDTLTEPGAGAPLTASDRTA